jgi:chromosome segregation ATPase
MINRYRPTVTNVQATAYCGEHPDGEYVKYSDYADREARLAEAIECCTIKDNRNLRLEAELSALKRVCEVHKQDAMREIAEANELAAKCDGLEARLAEAETYIEGRHTAIREMNALYESNKARLTEAERALRVFHAMIDPFDATPEESALWYEWQARVTVSAPGEKP